MCHPLLLPECGEARAEREIGRRLHRGRAKAADIGALSGLHALEFALLARPPYLAARNIGPIARALLAGLEPGPKPSLTVMVGHDTNVASLGGLLDLHWQAPGFARDDPTPGGALVFQLVRDAQGGHLVRAFYRAQGLRQLRKLKPGAEYRAPLAIPACGTPCPLDRFRTLVTAKLDDAESPPQ